MLTLGEHFTFLILVAKSWTKRRLRLWSVCSSRAYEGKEKSTSQRILFRLWDFWLQSIDGGIE